MGEFEPSVSNNFRKLLHSLIWDIDLLFFKWIRADKHSRKTESQESSQSISDKDNVCFSDYPNSLESVDESPSSPENETENEFNRTRKQVSEPDDIRTSSPGAGISYVDSNDSLFRILDELSDVLDRHKNDSSEKRHYKIPSKEKISDVHENIFEFLCQGVLECVDGDSYTSNEVQDESRHSILKEMREDSSNIEIRKLKLHVNELKEKLGQCTKSYGIRENTYRKRVQELQDRCDSLQTRVDEAEENFMKTEQDLREALLELERNARLTEKLTKTEESLVEAKEELRKTMVELGSVSVENTMMKRKLPELSQPHDVCTQTSDIPSPRLSSRTDEPSSAEALQNQKERVDDVTQVIASNQPEEAVASSVQVSREESSGREEINLYNRPTTAVARSVYNNYKLLLLTISQWLLSDDVVKLKEWASGSFSVNVAQDVDEVFRELDRKGAISSSNLDTLRAFFERILRVDLMHLIDCFLRGDYGLLRATNSTESARNISRRSGGTRSISPQGVTGNPGSQTSTRSYPEMKRPGYSSLSSGLVNAKDSFFVSRTAVKNMAANSSSAASSVVNHGVHQGGAEVVSDGPGGQADASEYNDAWNRNPTKGPNQARSAESSSRPARKPQAHFGSNGNKLSKFQRPDSSANSNRSSQGVDNNSDDEGPWLCSHYKRRCHVKFSCCDEYWPCHRCHNNESKCGEKKLRSRDTKYIKCVNCGTEQEFSERSQFCVNCNSKLAKYFCAICKHLTGTDDNPYHCEKCGICRIHRDRSFHCDVCGVCLDVQLRGNHKCRAGSAHDECCICLEDAFTGCQILPCSHKVHKECATQMIRRGITRCPICRESFAHKLERRPIQPPKKQSGKK